MIKMVVSCLLISSLSMYSQVYHWQTDTTTASLLERIETPVGYKRITAKEGSFAHWLRHLPMKDGQPQVMLYNGRPKGNQQAQHAVIDIDVGARDLQQCADAVMRLRAEFLYSRQAWEAIHFNYTSGDRIDFLRWEKGERPVVKGNKVSWKTGYTTGASYQNFKAYLQNIFTYAGTWSLRKELAAVSDLKEIQPGDVFIQGGFPGHAVVVLDVAESPQSGEKLFLLSQSYMPAQDIHVLKNPTSAQLSPWYSTNIDEELRTPEWTFKLNDLRRFTE